MFALSKYANTMAETLRLAVPASTVSFGFFCNASSAALEILPTLFTHLLFMQTENLQLLLLFAELAVKLSGYRA